MSQHLTIRLPTLMSGQDLGWSTPGPYVWTFHPAVFMFTLEIHWSNLTKNVWIGTQPP